MSLTPCRTGRNKPDAAAHANPVLTDTGWLAGRSSLFDHRNGSMLRDWIVNELIGGATVSSQSLDNQAHDTTR